MPPSYFRETWKPRNTTCSSPSALSGVLDRRGMGALGKLPLELLIEVFKLVPFRPRLKATIFVCKSFHGLIFEKSLWSSVETDRALVGPTLAYMIQPGCASAEPLLPRGSVDGVAINMAYCTTGDVLAIIKRLQSSQNHALASLSLTGSSRPVLSATLSHLCRHARSLARIATLHLGGCSVGEAAAPFLAALPALLHLRLDSEVGADARLLRCVGGRLKTLVAPKCEVSVATAAQLGGWFPGLETLEVRVAGGSGEVDMVGLPWLRVARLAWCGGGGGSGSGHNVEEEEEEEDVSRFFVRLVAAAQRLRVLSFVAEGACGAGADVLRCVGPAGVASPELRTVVLEGWAPVQAARVDAVWRCPVLVEAPWLWVDVERRRRQRQRRRQRRQRGCR